MKTAEYCRKAGIIGILVLAIALAPVVQAQSGSITATLTDDTWIESGEGIIPAYGDLPAIEAGMWTTAFLKFNLSSVPDGVTGITAVLELYTYVNGVEDPHVVTAYLLDNTTWNEHDPPWIFVPQFELDVLDGEYVATSERWYEWNVTDGVIDSLSNSSDVVSFVLCYPETSGSEMPYVFFASKEGSITKIPKLTIIWESIIPDLPSNLLVVLGIVTLSVGALFIRKKLMKARTRYT
jgi:hypothetical protein